MNEQELEKAVKRIPSLSSEELENRFSFHPANTDAIRQAHEAIRNTCLRVAVDLNSQLPNCDEKLLAIKKLEEVMFWSNAAIARHK